MNGEQIWALHATYGFPLELSVPLLADRDEVPAWDMLIRAAEQDGVDRPRFIRRLQEIARDAYSPDVAAVIVPRLALALCDGTP